MIEGGLVDFIKAEKVQPPHTCTLDLPNADKTPKSEDL